MRHNNRPHLLLSRIPDTQIDLLPDGITLIVCTDCRTWHRLQRGMVPAHRMEERGHGLRNRRCEGSGQRVQFDVTITAWQGRQERLLPDALPAETRTAGHQFYKPLPPVAAPVHKLTRQMPTAKAARTAYLQHRQHCTTCTSRCPNGAALAQTYLRLQRQEQRTAAVAAERERAQTLRDRIEADVQPLRRAAQWREQLGSVRSTDTQRAQLPEGATVRGPIFAPEVPLEPLHPAV